MEQTQNSVIKNTEDQKQFLLRLPSELHEWFKRQAIRISQVDDWRNSDGFGVFDLSFYLNSEDEMDIDVAGICQAFAEKYAGPKEIDPTPGASLDVAGKLSLLALDLSAEQMMVKIAMALAKEILVKEFFVSLDANNRPCRAQTFHSLLIIFHVVKDGKNGPVGKIGVMEYGWSEGLVVIEDVRWDDDFWSSKYASELDILVKASGEVVATDSSGLLN